MIVEYSRVVIQNIERRNRKDSRQKKYNDLLRHVLVPLFAKEIYGSGILLPINIKDTPKKSDDNENNRVRKLANSIRKYNEDKQSLSIELSLQAQYQGSVNSRKKELVSCSSLNLSAHRFN
ncbi:hypothetical protein ACTFIW_006055 [Dictyostelium discoideum]